MARKPVDDDEDDDLDEAPPEKKKAAPTDGDDEDDEAPVAEGGGNDDEPPPDFDDDDEDGEKKGGKLKIILISVAALFFVLGAAGGAYFFFFTGHGDEEAAADEAEAPDDGTAMAIPTRRRMLTADELAKQQAEGGGAATSGQAPSSQAGLTPPAPRASGGTAPAPAASAAPAPPPTLTTPAEAPAANAKAPAKGAKGAPAQGGANPQDAGLVTPAVTAVAFKDIPVQPPAKPLGAPDSSYVEVGEYGNMPRAQKGGNGGVWRAFAAPFGGPADKPKVAVIITGLGYSRNATLAAMGQLPPNVTLAFDPYAKGVDEWMGLARSNGHEVLMALPMEPGDFPISDPGPLAMLTDLEASRNVDRLHKIFSNGLGYVGMLQTMGSKFAASEAAMRPVMAELKTRGVLYVSSGTVQDDKGETLAGEVGVPFTMVDLKLDEVETPAAIDAQLTRLEKLAREDGTGVAVASATPLSIGKLATWTSSLALKEISLAPVSAVAQIKAAAGGEGKGGAKGEKGAAKAPAKH